MTEIKQVQGSIEWLQERRGKDFKKISATDAVVICGWGGKYRLVISLWQHLLDLIDGKVGIDSEYIPPEIQPIQIKVGHKAEPLLRELYSSITGNVVEDGSYFVHPNFPDRYGTSLDGHIYLQKKPGEGVDFDGPLECKSIMGEYKGYPIAEHILQMQYQMWVTKKPWVDYIASRTVLTDEKNVEFKFNEVIIYRVYRNEDYIKQMVGQVDYFIERVSERKKPLLLIANEKCPRTSIPVKIEDLINGGCYVIEWHLNPKAYDVKKMYEMKLVSVAATFDPSKKKNDSLKTTTTLDNNNNNNNKKQKH